MRGCRVSLSALLALLDDVTSRDSWVLSYPLAYQWRVTVGMLVDDMEEPGIRVPVGEPEPDLPVRTIRLCE